MSALALKTEILRMAEIHENSWVKHDTNIGNYGYYEIDLIDMQEDNEWSFPAYLLLEGNWNDAIDWAETVNPLSFVKTVDTD